VTAEATERSAPDLFARIVCAVDGSPEGLDGVRQAQRLSHQGSAFTLVSISESHLAVHAGAGAAQWVEQLDREAQTALDEGLGVVGTAAAVLLRGRATDAILRTLAERRASLAAVGSHEFARGAGMLIGSVATRLIHDAPCSVLIARPTYNVAQWPSSVVVGLDGSASSLAAAEIADTLARRFGASVRFVVARGAGLAEIAPAELESCDYELTFSDDKPVAALLAAARDADLLLVGSRGLTGIRSLGSVSERVAHRAPCSLIVVR
jgi:nucleotide-binding universal stress UspA family protein